MSRDDVIVRARVAEKSERFADMAKAMKTLCEMSIDLSNDERNMFSYAYKNLAGMKRRSWRVISSMEQQFNETTEPWKYEKLQIYREKIQAELEELCNEVLSLIEKQLPLAQTDETKLNDQTFEACLLGLNHYVVYTEVTPQPVFITKIDVAFNLDNHKVYYLKMKGDYRRYQAEVIGDPVRRRKMVSTADKVYKEAIEVSDSTLRPAHPIRLGLALNYSVFLYEVKAANKKAIKITKEAFEEAVEEFNTGVFKQDEYKDSTIVLKLMKDNVKMWSSIEGPAINLLPD